MAKVMLVAIDIGNVCVQLHIEESIAKFGWDPATPIPQSAAELCGLVGLGKISAEEFLEGMSKVTGLPQGEVMKIWNSQIGAAVPGMTEAVRHYCSLGVEFVFLSDTNDLHMAEVRRTLPFANLVKDAVLSQEVGALKPDPAMFLAFEKAHGVPDLYFDDLEKNIAGAAARGWNAIRFTGVDVFRSSIDGKLSGRL